MSLKDKTARQSLTNYPSAELKNYLKQHPTTATSPTCTSASEPLSNGADVCSKSANIKVGSRVVWTLSGSVNTLFKVDTITERGTVLFDFGDGELTSGTLNHVRLATSEEEKLGHRIDYCPHGYDVACLICAFGKKDGKRVYHTPSPVVINIESMSATKQAEFKERLQEFQNNIHDGLGLPSPLLTKGGNFESPYTSKEAWQKAFLATQNFDPNSIRKSDWPTDWPTDAHFYRININTPIFYKYESGQIKRWIKYAKCWVDSCIPDWPIFYRQNAVKGLRSWPIDNYKLNEYGYSFRDGSDCMIHVRGEFPAYGASDAVISPCEQYRYQLRRHGSSNNRKGPAVFLMLNPSTADATTDDPTIKRCRRFAESFGYSGLIVINLYALRSTDPAGLWEHYDPIGPANNRYLRQIAAMHSEVICAWGANARAIRVGEVTQIFKDAGCKMLCLGTNKNGSPKHPLYIKADTNLIEWRP